MVHSHNRDTMVLRYNKDTIIHNNRRNTMTPKYNQNNNIFLLSNLYQVLQVIILSQVLQIIMPNQVFLVRKDLQMMKLKLQKNKKKYYD